MDFTKADKRGPDALERQQESSSPPGAYGHVTGLGLPPRPSRRKSVT